MAKTVLQIAIDEEDLPIFESLFEKFEVESSVIEEKAKPLFTIAVDELLTAKKGLEWGLLTDIDAVYSAIFDEIK